MKTSVFASITLLVISLWSGVASAAAIVGQPAPDFTATDSNGASVALSSLEGKTVVLEWMNPSCPFTQKHYRSGNMQSLQEYARQKDVVWLSVNTASANSASFRPAAEMNAWLSEMKAAPTSLLMDSDATVAKLYGAKTTPHLFVINPKGVVIYAGAIDDKRSVALEDVKVARNYVKAALDESLTGKPVSTPSTQPYGCPVKY
ncbi:MULTISPECIES: redoxin domain-containing protein [unclassified Pseudomonas]|uniref:redoxin domain-containing protein n=1 Tax=unclassified Pseudomonas TaxID=196821 RepID=UPI000C86CD4D|nr:MULTISPECIES: redoxin domain-containing protein [unclassified Pseudomonas]PMV97115.1 thioredoxin family protein [Pseudomonas sp. GW460-C8]PMW17149.1 thioredoxin family protein [Pseudomonas sp. GW456-11-11-14-TSB2]PMW21059.1 thioredoxin family protein [Pseudomonas sp. GW456-E6]PMW33559.1 thioredoxin family protein [Pseudomonas sp. FW305-3-2-15-A-R2A1]PMW36542.1 thioredoxin family protein [Pseudomonas sp. GW460-7]